MGLLKLIFIVIIVYYVLKLIGRYVLPYLVSFFIKRAQDRMMGNQNNSTKQKQTKKEGEVSINSAPKKSNNPSKEKLGDYVDFEEVND